MTARLHSAETLMNGTVGVKFASDAGHDGDHDARKRSLQENIKEPSALCLWSRFLLLTFTVQDRKNLKHSSCGHIVQASQERIAALRRKLSNQCSPAAPSVTVPGISAALKLCGFAWVLCWSFYQATTVPSQVKAPAV